MRILEPLAEHGLNDAAARYNPPIDAVSFYKLRLQGQPSTLSSRIVRRAIVVAKAMITPDVAETVAESESDAESPASEATTPYVRCRGGLPLW
jgi:hypothetical protein